MIDDAPLSLPAELLELVRAAYATPGRAYHDLSHIDEVVRRWHDVAAGPGWREPRETYLAVLFHDAVYVPGAKDNEARSAALATEAVTRFGLDVRAERAAALITLTARHGSLTVRDVDAEAALFLDCDMAILGADDAAFTAYEAGVAAEYAFVPPELYRAGRRAFLQSVLGAERIFLSDFWHARLDAVARTNLTRALRQLGD